MEDISRAGQTTQAANLNMVGEKAGAPDEKKAIASGNLKGDNLRISSKDEADGKVLKELKNGVDSQKPQLVPPKELKTDQMQTTSKTLMWTSESTDKAMKSGASLYTNLLNGEMTKEESTKLKAHAQVMDDTASYLDALSGKGVESSEGKRQVLAGLGFLKGQLDNLEFLAEPKNTTGEKGANDVKDLKDVIKFLSAQHGGTKSLDHKASILRNMGYSDSQIKMLLSLAPSDEDTSRLQLMLREAEGSDPRSVLKALGLTSALTEKWAGVLTGQFSKMGTAEQKALLMKMGFSGQEAEMILLSSEPNLLKEQATLMGPDNQRLTNALRFGSEGVNLLSSGVVFDDIKILEQLVDIFTVMEMLFEMSAVQRASARQSRTLEYESSRQEILNQAKELQKSALMTAVGGWVSAGMKIAGGAVQTGGAIKAGFAQNQAAMQQQTAIANGVSMMVTALGDGTKAVTDYYAGLAQADVKIHESRQKSHDNVAQSDTEFMNLHQDMLKTVISKMDEIIRAWFETLKSTTRA